MDKNELWEGYWSPLLTDKGKINIELLKEVLYDEYYLITDKLQEAKEIGLIDENTHRALHKLIGI